MSLPKSVDCASTSVECVLLGWLAGCEGLRAATQQGMLRNRCRWWIFPSRGSQHVWETLGLAV